MWKEAGCASTERAAASLVFGKRGRVAIFLCLEVLGQIGEMPTVKLKVRF